MKNSALFALGLILFGLIVATNAGSALRCQSHGSDFLLNCTPDENTVVRFFYNPPGDYFHFPLIFRSVQQGDRRLDTAPMTSEGRTAYISSSEMPQLVDRLAHSNLLWRESEKVERLGSYKMIPVSRSMEILVLCPKWSARANLAPKNICETLAPLGSALKTRRALWEFELFRQGYGCRVPGFNPEAYPDH